MMIIASAIFPFVYHDGLLALIFTVELVLSAIHFKAIGTIFITTFSCRLGNTALGFLHSLLTKALHACLSFCFELLGRDAAQTRLLHIAEPLHSLLLFRFNRFFCLDAEAFLTLFDALF